MPNLLLRIIVHIFTRIISSQRQYALDSLELIAGSLPLRQRRLVEAWAELHQRELMENWELALEGHRPRPIAPLQ